MKKLALGAGMALGIALTNLPGSAHPASPIPSDDKAIVHLLDRAGFGPRPGDVGRVRQLGLERYLDQQLHPERIPDAGVLPRLAGLTTVGLSSREIATRFEIPLLQERRRRQAAGQATGQDAGPDQQAPPPEMLRRGNQPIAELSQQKLLRAIYSERQLQEVLADFWFNHFNVDARKGASRFLLTEYERDTIRPHVLGKFRDLLGATAKSPAMLFYLDNWMSADPNGPHVDSRLASRPGRGFGGRPGQRTPQNGQANRAPRGLNENYGRELMELHTLGVDGGYTQKDVTEVARAFTGWTIDRPRQGGGFKFEPRIHDPGEKIVLGHRIKAGGGENDGEQVLDILAQHPSTAHFLATALVRRFVSDTPPASLVDRAAERFRQTDGDLREVMRTILTSPEFFAADAYRAKVKTPLEFVVSAVRAVGADVQDALPLVRAMQQLGMPLYLCQPPTGYKDTADAWVNAGALVNRMNVALALASGQWRGITVDGSDSVIGRDSGDVVASLLHGDVSASTRATIDKATSVPQMVALTLGAPEFQRR